MEGSGAVFSYSPISNGSAQHHVTYEQEAGEDITYLKQLCTDFEFWVCVVVIGCICLLGGAGNILSLIVLARYKADGASVFLLQTLSVADSVLLLTTVLVYMPVALATHSGSGHVPPVLLTLQIYTWPLSLMAHTITIWVTVLLTLTRYKAVCQLVREHGTLKATQMKVAILVMLSILYNVPRFFEYQPVRHVSVQTVHPNGSVSTHEEAENLGDIQAYQVIYSIVLYYPVMYIVPLAMLAYLNTKLLRTLRDVKNKRQLMTGHKAKEDHVTLIIVVIVFFFIICQTPALVNQIFWATLTMEQRDCGSFHFFYTKISDTLVIFNSSSNFVVYCLFSKTFRQVFAQTLCKGLVKNCEDEMTGARPLRDLSSRPNNKRRTSPTQV